MLSRETINKMDTDELRNYLYLLQDYTKTVREINSARKANEDFLICLLHKQEDLSNLTLKEKNKIDQLARLTGEIKQKYLSACPSYVCEFKTESEIGDQNEK